MRTFLRSCCIILTLAAWAKLYSATGHSGILAKPDVLLGMSNRILLLAAGVLELGVSAFLLLSEDNISKCACVLWLALNFTMYRMGIYWLHPGALCPCLGNVTDKLGLKPEIANRLLEATVVYMLAGSVFFLIRELRHHWLRKTTYFEQLTSS